MLMAGNLLTELASALRRTISPVRRRPGDNNGRPPDQNAKRTAEHKSVNQVSDLSKDLAASGITDQVVEEIQSNGHKGRQSIKYYLIFQK